ncbi:unnamed protein product [Symbiodinium microadriaticum]|nr:unnamed protein product [Symbiodinium microadriaticum]
MGGKRKTTSPPAVKAKAKAKTKSTAAPKRGGRAAEESTPLVPPFPCRDVGQMFAASSKTAEGGKDTRDEDSDAVRQCTDAPISIMLVVQIDDLEMELETLLEQQDEDDTGCAVESPTAVPSGDATAIPPALQSEEQDVQMSSTHSSANSLAADDQETQVLAKASLPPHPPSAAAPAATCKVPDQDDRMSVKAPSSANTLAVDNQETQVWTEASLPPHPPSAAAPAATPNMPDPDVGMPLEAPSSAETLAEDTQQHADASSVPPHPPGAAAPAATPGVPDQTVPLCPEIGDDPARTLGVQPQDIQMSTKVAGPAGTTGTSQDIASLISGIMKGKAKDAQPQEESSARQEDPPDSHVHETEPPPGPLRSSSGHTLAMPYDVWRRAVSAGEPARFKVFYDHASEEYFRWLHTEIGHSLQMATGDDLAQFQEEWQETCEADEEVPEDIWAFFCVRPIEKLRLLREHLQERDEQMDSEDPKYRVDLPELPDQLKHLAERPPTLPGSLREVSSTEPSAKIGSSSDLSQMPSHQAPASDDGHEVNDDADMPPVVDATPDQWDAYIKKQMDAYPCDDLLRFELCFEHAVLALQKVFRLPEAAPLEDPRERVASVTTFHGSKATNLDLCLAAITSRGYAVETFLIDAKTYGLPQNRRRIYILCWNTSNPSMAGSPKKFFDDVKVMMAAMRFDPPPVAITLDYSHYAQDRFLLPDDDEAVMGELEDLEKERADQADRAESSTTSWQSLHMSVAEKRGISWPLKVHPDLSGSRWFALLNPRVQVVAFADDERIRLHKPIEFVDAYHGANRYSTGLAGAVPIVLPRTIGWSFRRQRKLLGAELLRLQGMSFGRSVYEQFTDAQLSDLAGNAFAANVAMAVIMAALCAIHLSSASDVEEAKEIDSMVADLIGERLQFVKSIRGGSPDGDESPFADPSAMTVAAPQRRAFYSPIRP